MKKELKGVPFQVFILGVVSFLTDVSSDMIYPLLPIFLTQTLGAGQSFVGLVEGFAESAAAFFTLMSGLWADRVRDRSKLVLGGYAFSSFSRPLMALASTPWVVFFVRFADRIGKGIRTSPRDALIADSVEPHQRGKAFGLQRSMDHAGAVMGPLTATLLLLWFIKDLRQLFWIAAIPGIFATLLVFWKVKEVLPKDRPLAEKKIKLTPPKDFRLRIYLGVLFLFILSCSSDAFLLLRASQLGVAPAFLPVIWMVFNLVKAITTLPLGMLSDRFGRRRVILAGWIIYTLVYVGFALASQAWHVWALFVFYGFFYGFTEGSERAILADYSEISERGQVYGWYYLVVGLGALPASLLFGALWQWGGAKTAFLVSAGMSFAAAVLLALFLFFRPSLKP